MRNPASLFKRLLFVIIPYVRTHGEIFRSANKALNVEHARSSELSNYVNECTHNYE
jgi:hypothetical protein